MWSSDLVTIFYILPRQSYALFGLLNYAQSICLQFNMYLYFFFFDNFVYLYKKFLSFLLCSPLSHQFLSCWKPFCQQI